MTPVPTIQVLRAAQRLVANEKTWTHNTNARTPDGVPTSVCDSRASCWCASGAIIKSGLDAGLTREDIHPLSLALDRIAERLHGRWFLSSVNDGLGRLAALSVIDAAIAELEGK